MRTILFSFILALFPLLLPAQERDESIRTGLGIALNPAAIVVNTTDMFLPIGLMNFYLPLQFGSHFRLEPEIGIVTIDDTIQETQDKQENSWRYVRLGSGVFYTWATATTTHIHIGSRAGVLWYSATREIQTETPATTSVQQTSWYAGLCAAGEYFMSPNFSLGAELQLNYVVIGNAKQEPASAVSTSRHIFTNNGLVALRFYW